MVHRCPQNKTPQCLVDCCTAVSDVASRQHLRSASCHLLYVPRHRRSMFGHRVFSVAGPFDLCRSPNFMNSYWLNEHVHRLGLHHAGRFFMFHSSQTGAFFTKGCHMYYGYTTWIQRCYLFTTHGACTTVINFVVNL